MAAALRGTSDEPEDPTVRLEQSLGGWDLVFHPRFADSLGRLGDSTLLNADYRIALRASTGGAEAQSAGFPTAIFDTVARQMKLVDLILERGLLERLGRRAGETGEQNRGHLFLEAWPDPLELSPGLRGSGWSPEQRGDQARAIGRRRE